ncbi:hypothetical protein K5X82_05745 [Halosquirtibacter xylanolyticus]|uniref:hypothetical protein n=1 Tax=Halosquirtibacter xylanolyticus TaxID=3374599 RepID=UPI00374A384D|nr:hypothetical protein K5X82_05745 [Prolixibacteraceae bacterium]
MASKFLNIYTSFIFALVAYAFTANIVMPLIDYDYCCEMQEQTSEFPQEQEDKGDQGAKDDLKKKIEDAKFCSNQLDKWLFLNQGHNNGSNEFSDLFHSHYQEVLSPPPDYTL